MDLRWGAVSSDALGRVAKSESRRKKKRKIEHEGARESRTGRMRHISSFTISCLLFTCRNLLLSVLAHDLAELRSAHVT